MHASDLRTTGRDCRDRQARRVREHRGFAAGNTAEQPIWCRPSQRATVAPCKCEK